MDSIKAAGQGNVCKSLKKVCNAERWRLAGNPCEEMEEFIEMVRERQWMVVGHFLELS